MAILEKFYNFFHLKKVKILVVFLSPRTKIYKIFVFLGFFIIFNFIIHVLIFPFIF